MEFEKFNKIPRLSRDCTISEKIDGTNAQIFIVKTHEVTTEFMENHMLFEHCGLCMFAGSKNRWLDTSSAGDNYGFAKWVQANVGELLKLGEGRHYGEWWGKGIQRGYGMDEKAFSLFNAGRWINSYECYSAEYEGKKKENCPECCRVVPILYEGMFDTVKIPQALEKLRIDGSWAKPGYLMPEGIIIYHTASGKMFKKTIMNDEKRKGK